MKLEQLDNIEYLQELSQNFELLKKETDGDMGIILSRMNNWGIFPEKELLLKINNAATDFFLLKNYSLEREEIINIKNKNYLNGTFNFFKKHLGEENKRELYLNNGYYDVEHKLPFNISLPAHLKEQETLLKTLECWFLQVEIHSDSSGSVLFHQRLLFEIIFNEEKPEVLKELFSYKSVRDLCNSHLTQKNSYFLSYHSIEALWQNKFNIDDLNYCRFDENNPLKSINDVINLVKKFQKDIDINSLFPYLPLSLKLEVAKSDLAPNFSNKALDVFLTEPKNRYTFIKQRLKGVNKSPNFVLLENFEELTDIIVALDIKIKEAHPVQLPIEKMMNEINEMLTIMDKISSSMKPGCFDNFHKELKGYIFDILPFFENNFLFLDTLEKTNKKNDFIKKLKEEVLKFNNYFFEKRYGYGNLHESFLNVGEDSLNKLFAVNNGYGDLNDLSESASIVFKRMIKEKSELMNDFLKFNDGKSISFNSPVFKDPLFAINENKMSSDVFRCLPDSMLNEAFERFNVDVDLSYVSYSYLFSLELKKEHLAFIEARRNKDNSDLPRIQKVFLAYVDDFNPAISKDKTILNKEHLNDILNFKRLINKEEKKILGSGNIVKFTAISKLESLHKIYSVRLSNKHNEVINLLSNKSVSSDYIKDLFNSLVPQSFSEANEINKCWNHRFLNEKGLEDYYLSRFVLNELKAGRGKDIPHSSYWDLVARNVNKETEKEKETMPHLSLDKKEMLEVIKFIFHNNFVQLNTDVKTNKFLRENHKKLNFEDLFDNDPHLVNEAKDFIIKNSPASVLSGVFNFLLPIRNELTFLKFCDLAKNSSKDLGSNFLGVSDSSSIIARSFISKATEKEYEDVVESMRKENHLLYSYFSSSELMKNFCGEGSCLSNKFQKWLTLNSKKVDDLRNGQDISECSEVILNTFVWSLVDIDSLVNNYDAIRKSYIKIDLLDKKEQNSPRVNLSDFNNLFQISGETTPYIERERAEELISKLLDKDLGFFGVVIFAPNLERVVSKEFIASQVVKNMESITDLHKVFSLLLYVEQGVVAKSKGLNLSNDLIDEGFYQNTLKELIVQNKHFSSVFEEYINYGKLIEENFITGSKTIGDELLNKNENLRGILSKLSKAGFDLPDLLARNNLKNKLNAHISSVEDIDVKDNKNNESLGTFKF